MDANCPREAALAYQVDLSQIETFGAENTWEARFDASRIVH